MCKHISVCLIFHFYSVPDPCKILLRQFRRKVCFKYLLNRFIIALPANLVAYPMLSENVQLIIR